MLVLPSEVFGFLSLHRPIGVPPPDFLGDLSLVASIGSAMQTMLLHVARQPAPSCKHWIGFLQGGWCLMEQVRNQPEAEMSMSQEMCDLVQMLLSLMSFQIPMLDFQQGSIAQQVSKQGT